MLHSLTRLRFEQLETRLTPAATTQFVGGNLRVIGDGNANAITVDVTPRLANMAAPMSRYDRLSSSSNNTNARRAGRAAR